VPAIRGRLDNAQKAVKIGRVLPVVEEPAGAGQLRYDRLQFGAAGDCDIGAARRPRDVAGELDHVAIALIGDQQQGAARSERPAVPLRAAARRQQWRYAGKPQPPLVFLPAAGEIALQQRRFGDAEMRAGKFRVERQRALGGSNCRRRFQAIVIEDTEIVVAMRIGGVERHGPLAGGERRVAPTERAIDLAQIAVEERRARGERDRPLDQFGRLRHATLAKEDDAFLMHGARLIRGVGEQAVDYAFGLVEATFLFEPVGQCQ
jgi:hypothetical protein